MSNNSLTDMSSRIWQRDSDASYRINRACYIIIFESCIQVKARIIGEEYDNVGQGKLGIRTTSL